jgi:ADP-ribosylglycohydrolase
VLYLCYRYGIVLAGNHVGVGKEEGEDKYKQHEDAALFSGSVDGTATSMNQRAAAAFEAALLSNTNLAGDNVNRGMLIGGILGLMLGFHNLPAHLVDGLYRYRKEEGDSGSSGSLRASVKAFVDSVIEPQLSAIRSGSALIPSRYGRPEPFWGSPRLRYPDCGFGAPRDLRHKLKAIAAVREKMGKKQEARLRFVKGAGTVTLPPITDGGTAADAAVAIKLEITTSLKSSKVDTAGGSSLDLDGDAVKDRELFLSGQQSSKNDSASGVSGFIPLKDLHPNLLDEELAVNCLLAMTTTDSTTVGELGVVVEPGTGVFYYPGSGGAETLGDDGDEGEPWRAILKRAFEDAAGMRGLK